MEKRYILIEIVLFVSILAGIYYLSRSNMEVVADIEPDYSEYRITDDLILNRGKRITVPPILEVLNSKAEINRLDAHSLNDIKKLRLKAPSINDFLGKYTIIVLEVPGSHSKLNVKTSNRIHEFKNFMKGLDKVTKDLPVQVWVVRATLIGDKRYSTSSLFGTQHFDKGFVIEQRVKKKKQKVNSELRGWISNNFFVKSAEKRIFWPMTLLVGPNGHALSEPLSSSPLSVSLFIKDLIKQNNAN